MRTATNLLAQSLVTDTGRVRWLVNRFQSAEPAEIFSRSLEACRHLVLAGTLRRIRNRRGIFPERASYPLTASTSDVLEKVSELDKTRTVATANQWLEHHISIFALHATSFDDSIDWHRDYSSGIVGPKKYSAFINYRDANRVGDVKYIWELNRLQHLVLLALASAWTGMEEYAKEIHKQTSSWYEQNPFMIGLNWKSPLEAGMRLISWALVSFVLGKLSPKAIFHKEFRESIYQHQYFIRKFYSKHSSANNHLIGEMAGLYVSSVFWPYYRESRSWRAFARQKLLEEIVRQVEIDGVGKERATEYQLFILEFFLLAGALGQAIRDPFPSEYWERVQRMALFFSAIVDRNGNFPLLGDGDSGQVVALPQSTQERVHSILHACQLINEPKAEEGKASGDLRSRLLLWGQRSDQMPLPPLPRTRTQLQAFPEGGHYILASTRGGHDEVIVVFDAGPLGFPPLYAHGHADALSFWLSYGGREFFIDPGTFCYYTHDAWRAYFRGTAAHNTLRIDGVDQSLAGGRFLWRHIARSYVEHVQDTYEFMNVKAFHDGYKRLTDSVIHRRDMRLYKKSRTLIVTDYLECREKHNVEIFFHFSEQCEPRRVTPESFIVINGDRRMSLSLDSRLETQLYRGSEGLIFGWVSRTFGIKQPSFTLVAKTTISGSTQFVSEIIPL